jgi:hypothetical protein
MGASTRVINITPVFIPLPFLAFAALESISHNPIDLIPAIKTATKDFTKSSNGPASHLPPCNRDFHLPPTCDATDGVKHFAKWLYAIHMNLVNETRFSVQPDNMKIQLYAEECHRKCILPPLEQKAPPHQGIENKSVIQQLIQATNRNNKVCKETNTF